MPADEARSDVTRFGHVDATGDAGSLIAFLDTANTLAGLRAAKQVLADQLRLAQACSVLDVGCGTGADLIAIAERLPRGGRAAGIDVSESMIAEARRRASSLDLNICFDCGDAANLPYEDASFAACRAATVLQHVPDADQVIREMIRVTRPGGRVAALEFDQDSTMLDHPDRDTTRVIVQTFGDAMANGWVGRQLPRLFRQAGLTNLSVSPVVNLGEPEMFQAMVRSHVGRLCADNVLTTSQADDWWHALQRQQADGHFLVGAVIFVVAATRPDDRTCLLSSEPVGCIKVGADAQCLLRLGASVTSRTWTSNPPLPRAARNRPPHSEPGCRVAARACLPPAGLASHFRLENTMIASKHTHVRSATWRALRHAATALRHVHREQALIWELWWQANRASVPSTGALRWVLTLDGHRLAGGHLATPRHDAAGGAA